MGFSLEQLLSGMICIFTVVLYYKRRMVKYYFKFTFFLLLSLFSATVFIPIMLLRPKDYRNALMPAWGARQISKLLGLQWKMKGKENIMQEPGSVIFINHQSCLDLLILSEIWPVFDRCTVISKKEVFYLWPFGLASWLWGTVFIDKLSGEKAQATINKTAETINSRKAKICMFPEGTRHGGDELLPFKKGGFHVAIASQCPIQPIVVSQYKFLDQNTYKFEKGTILISILPAISTKGLTKNDLGSLMEKVHKVMSEEYRTISEI